MNKAVIIGRLVADPEVRYTNGENPIAIARYRLAVNRRVKREGDQDADFISCVAFGKQGEFAEKYLHKGTKICVCGRIQTGSYEKDGQRVYTFDVVVEEHEFCESKASGGQASASDQSRSDNGFMQIPEGDEDLPFS